jgi:group I intron endonuclease
MLIYLFTFNNGKRYVGQTVRSLPVRVSQHRRMVKYGSLLPVHCAWRKHGEPRIEVLGEYVDMNDLHVAERGYIASLGTLSPHGYNVGFGGETAPSKSPDVAAKIAAKAKGRGHSDEAKAKITAALKGRWNDPDYRERVSAGIKAAMTDERRAAMSVSRKGRGKGRIVSEATKAKLRGRIVTAETRAKMSAAAKHRERSPFTAETREKIADNTRAAWQDEGITKRRIAAIRTARANPQNAAARSEKAKATWADPQTRERRLASMRSAWERRRTAKSSIA